MTDRRIFLRLCSLGLLLLTACGGGSMNAPSEPASSSISSVSAACVPAAMGPDATAQCSATVQGTGSYSSGISWSVSGGSITASGVFTAPASAGSVTITATSNQNSARSGSATVTVQAVPAAVTAVALSCAPLTVLVNATSQCSATVQGTGSYSAAVTWTASAGSVNANGLLTAPAVAGSVSVTATSTADTSKSATLSIAVQAPPAPPAPPTPPPPSPPTITSISASCSPTTVAPGAASQCTAIVGGTGSFSPGITWSASAGSISSGGLFVAPQAGPASATTVLISAISTQDSSKSATTSITLQPATAPAITSVAVVCSPTTIAPTTTVQCAATVQGTGAFSSTVSWSATGGTINASGLFTAEATAGSAIVTATSTEDTTKAGTADITVQLMVPASKHVVIVMEENQSYATVVGQSAWPNLNALINMGALATNYYADSHPSIGNYFMLTTGQLLTTSDSSTTVWNVDNIARRMLAAGVPFKVYAEGIPQGYLGGNTGHYLIRHNPLAMLSDVASNPLVANEIICPFLQFAIDLANNALPAYSFVVPDVEDDAHNGTPQQADTWLQSNLIEPLSNQPAFQAGGDGIFIVDFDEAEDSDTTHGGGRIPAVFWGPNVLIGYTQAAATVYQHESMLNTIMDALGLPNPPGLAATAPTMSEFFVQK